MLHHELSQQVVMPSIHPAERFIRREAQVRVCVQAGDDPERIPGERPGVVVLA